MKHYILKRIFILILVLLGVSILSFSLIELFGKDPAEIIARRGNLNATHEQIEAVRHSMGLDKPLYARFFLWLTGLFRGDVGLSICSFNPIMDDIARYLPVSLSLVGLSLLWVALFSVPISLVCARFPGGAADHIARVAGIAGMSFPAFWLGFLLLMAFAVKLPIFTVIPEPGIKGYLLPSFALAVPLIATFTRVFRAALLRELSSDYALYARARGFSRSRILIHHALKNALPPVIALFCQYTGYLVAGSAVVENVFSICGVGSYLVGCVLAADSTAVATCAVLTAFIFVAANFAGDLVSRLLCPWMVKEDNA